jgi:transcriptional antiterminator RfaH
VSENWCVVQTQTRFEEKAYRHLVKQNFTVYMPRYLRRVRHARRSVEALRPLFPGYLFVRLDPGACRWRSINGTMGVQRILVDGEAPKYLDEAIVRSIMDREDENGAIRMSRPSFLRGQAVRVTDGPFAEVDALFEDMRDNDRVMLLA